ncbi:AraC-like DNA-binding protein [Microbacterium resistens]|uniref:AraC-like DNA-binding protein n=2 Tax=Microbacterium resistens TaxID=156977 RepID=A0ABU1SGW0_9MICO|nr:AraC-like DNA-binding protein [Microbacterium resistens]
MSTPPHDPRRQPTLSSLGWRTREHAPQRSSVELTTDGSWVVARAWSTTGSLDAEPLGQGATRIIVGVDGAARVHLGEEAVDVRPGEMVVLDGATPARVENDGIWARCEWHLRSPALRQQKFRAHFARAIALLPGDYALVTAITNVISTREDLGEPGGASTLHNALTDIALTGMLNWAGERTTLSPTQAMILQEANAAIESRHADSAFDVRSLAEALHISDRHLRHVYALIGTTPRTAIETRRLAAADAVLGVTPNRGRDTYEAAAQSSGFRSARHLQQALNRRRDQAQAQATAAAVIGKRAGAQTGPERS